MQVSVVIPCHNSLRYLPETLDSVLDQQLPPSVSSFEVVLVDDGGDDDLSGWAARRGDDRVRVVRQDNAGVAAARNRGVAEARGELVAFCDSDDLWVPSTVADLAGCFVRDPGIALAYGWYEVVDGDSRPTGAVRRSDWQGWIWERLVTHNPIGASGVMVRRSVLHEVGGFAQNRDRFPIDVEDWELWLRIAAGHRVGLAPRVVFRYRRHGANASTDLESLELAYRHLMDVVFDGVEGSRAVLRPAAEARIDMVLAWQSLNDRGDPSRAGELLARARRRDPSVTRGAEYWRLRTAVAVLSRTGDAGYRALRGATGAARKVATAAREVLARRRGIGAGE